MSYLARQVLRNQREQLRADQEQNNAGGFVWRVSPMDRLKRFLVLGTEGGTYYQSERDLTWENITCIDQCLHEDYKATLDLIAEISVAGRAAKNDMALYALARAVHPSYGASRRMAWDLLPVVARTGTHLFMIEHFVKQIGASVNGRAGRRGIGGWYTSKSADELAWQMVKYRERNFTKGRATGRRHADLIKTSHPHSEDPELNAVLRWGIGKGGDTLALPQVIRGFELAQKATSSEQLAQLVHEYQLPWEALPRDMMGTDVWRSLLQTGMPTHALIRNLATMTRVGALHSMSPEIMLVAKALADPEALRRARLHPLQALAAHLTYSAGRSIRGDATWTPIQPIVDMLHMAFYDSFGAVEPIGKRICLALDVSGSMYGHSLNGVPGLSAALGAAAMALVTANVESQYQIVGFTTGSPGARFWQPERVLRGGYGFWQNSGLEELAISPRQRLDDVVRYMRSLPMGGTDCSMPMWWAQEQRREFDLFVIYTDSETWAGDVHASVRLQNYRKALGIDAKLVVVAMTSSGFSIADPNDPGMLDMVGFDTATPNLISQFANL